MSDRQLSLLSLMDALKCDFTRIMTEHLGQNIGL